MKVEKENSILKKKTLNKCRWAWRIVLSFDAMVFDFCYDELTYRGDKYYVIKDSSAVD